MKTIGEEKREELIMRVIDSPQSLTAEDFKLIQSDEELLEIYNAAVLCKEANTIGNVEIPDVEDELSRFKAGRKKVLPFYNRWSSVMRIAAIFVGLVVGSIVIVAAFVPRVFDFVTGYEEQAESEQITQQIKSPNTVVAGSEPVNIINEKALNYDNVTLEAITNELAEIYKIKVVFESEKAKGLRLYLNIEQGKTIQEIVETLGAFEQFDVSLDGEVLSIK